MARRLVAAVLLVAALLAVPAPSPAAGYTCPGLASSAIAYAFEQITVSTTAIAFTVATYTAGGQAPVMAVVSLNATNGIRWRADGTNPTATVGMLVAGGSTIVVCEGAIGNWRAIREGGADAVANVTYFRRP